MAEIDIAQIKSILTAAKKARGSGPRPVAPGRQESSADERKIKKLLTPLLDKAGLDVGALEKILKQDKAHADRKPTADAVKRHAWMKKNVVKNMRARAGARRQSAVSARAVSPLDQPTVTETIQPFYIWPQPVGILTQSNLAVDDNWARVRIETSALYGGDYVSFLYVWTNPNDFAVGIDVDTSLAFIGYCSVRAGALGGLSNAHISAHMNIYEMGDQDETFGPATVSTPVIPVLDIHADSILSSDFNSAPVDSIVDISNDQVAVSAGASVLFELFASFVFDNIEGLFHEDSVAFFDFDSEYQISNPGMTITSTPVILF